MKDTYDVYLLKDTSLTKNNVYIIADIETKEAAVIDPACSIVQIRKLVEEKDLHISKILITHGHSDHIRNVEAVLETYSASVYVSREDADYFSCCWTPMIKLEDLDSIQLGNTNITVLHTPGHSPGSICFMLENCIFTGDTIFIEGCGLCGMYKNSIEDMFQSIQRIKSLPNENIKVYPGHTYREEPGLSLHYLKQYNVYMGMKTSEQFIAFRMRKNQAGLFHFK